ncbi:uncharacterized protein HD556DRAFT_1316715 [Suillus plorans]|uniref:DUF7704 domain-containing protein n=1 Tax=Suillus plorans TaxID=116603 RepID=A0A9P7E2V9_9AGAM|nr:uncharacterized protein HD556DRAFT_1316715 [Suillus plorans]KAG1809935.1 hypothetical protein HD556DRAFT_1316715 [Suillus plorans]
MVRNFAALPGFYRTLFLYIEPVSTVSPAILAWFFPGASWFHHELIPTTTAASGPLDARTTMAIWQLGNCYLLLGLISSLVFRAIRDALPNNPEAQERILGASFTALALADVTHIAASFIGLPDELKYSYGKWNPMTHGNITFVIFLLSARLAWFAGVGRATYYYGKRAKVD